jgi:hypothetical protein
MTDTPEPAAEWEADDVSQDGTPEPDTTTTEQPATEQPSTPPHPGIEWDAPNGKWIETEPRNREAKYRTQLRAAEAERDQLRERLERRDRAEVEHLVSGRLIDPQDLWAGGVTLADVVDPESGEISPQLIDEAVTRVVKEHPHWRFNPAAPASMVTSTHAGIDTDQQQPTWQSVFQSATRKA